MLTRAGVAKRLGRSLATVRRMEGSELHPWIDERGVHRFDAAEVDDFARRDANYSAPLPVIDDEPVPTETHAALVEARGQISAMGRQVAQTTSDAERASERARRAEREADDLRRTAIEALAMVETLLGGETPYAVRRLLHSLKRTG